MEQLSSVDLVISGCGLDILQDKKDTIKVNLHATPCMLRNLTRKMNKGKITNEAKSVGERWRESLIKKHQRNKHENKTVPDCSSMFNPGPAIPPLSHAQHQEHLQAKHQQCQELVH